MVTIRRACQDLKTHNLEGCVIYTSCEPCPMCLGAIYWSHLDHIYFSHSKSDAKEGKKKLQLAKIIIYFPFSWFR